MKFSAPLSLFLLSPSVVNGFATNQVKTPAVDSLKSTPFSYADNLGRGNLQASPENGRPMERGMERPMERSRTMVGIEMIMIVVLS